MNRSIYVSPRHAWLRDAIAATQDHIAEAVKENAVERHFAAPGTSDYDATIDEEACIERAEATLTALEAELAMIVERRDLRAMRRYEDD